MALAMRLTKVRPKPSTAIVARDLLARLGEGTKQPLDLGGGEPDAAVRHGEDEARLAARGPFAGHVEAHAAVLGELHRIVDEIFQRRPQPQRIADHRLRQGGGNIRRVLEPLGLGASGERSGERVGQAARADELAPQHETLGIGPRGIDDQRGEQGKMLGGALDRRRPTALARAELGRGQQLAQRQDAGQRRSDLMGDVRQRRLDRARMRRRRAPARLALGPTRPFASGYPWSRHRTPNGQIATQTKPPATAGSRKPDHPADVSRTRTSLAQRPQGGRAGRFRELLPVGVEDQAVVMVGGAGRPSSACSTRCTLVEANRSCPRTTWVTPWQRVVDHDREVIARGHLLARQHDVAPHLRACRDRSGFAPGARSRSTSAARFARAPPSCRVAGHRARPPPCAAAVRQARASAHRRDRAARRRDRAARAHAFRARRRGARSRRGSRSSDRRAPSSRASAAR